MALGIIAAEAGEAGLAPNGKGTFMMHAVCDNQALCQSALGADPRLQLPGTCALRPCHIVDDLMDRLPRQLQESLEFLGPAETMTKGETAELPDQKECAGGRHRLLLQGVPMRLARHELQPAPGAGARRAWTAPVAGKHRWPQLP